MTGLTAAGVTLDRGVSWAVRGLKTVAALVLVGTASPIAGGFSKEVPRGVPSVKGWMQISGDVEFGEPRVAVRYQFFVNPARPAAYEVVRYRVTPLGAAGSVPPAPGNEKLQWDRDGRDLRRFECVASVAADGGCAWKEMDKGGAAYRTEVGLLIPLYNAHNRKSQD